MKVNTIIFCDVVDFCQTFISEWQKSQYNREELLEGGAKKEKGLFKSDKAGSSKIQKLLTNEQAARDFCTNVVEHSKFFISLVSQNLDR
jgi:hypothetical protein